MSDCISHLVTFRTKKKNLNYFDDYFFAAFLAALCNYQVKVFLEVCEAINFPVAIHKTFWATSQLIFLGMWLDTEKQLICIPIEKVQKAQGLIEQVMNKEKITLLLLQRLCGVLNFLCRAIVPGRAFTRRLYAMGKGCSQPHHHLRVSAEMKCDLLIWQRFLAEPVVYSHPFIDMSNTLDAVDIKLYTDASKNPMLGMGGICGDTAWMWQQWSSEFIVHNDLSIEYLELYAVTAVVLAWISNFSNSRIVLHCDNLSVCAMLNSMSSSCRNCMVLIRLIVLQCMHYNVRVFARWVAGKSNFLSDCLSRLKFKNFHEASKSKYKRITPTAMPDTIWPMSKIWKSE